MGVSFSADSKGGQEQDGSGLGVDQGQGLDPEQGQGLSTEAEVANALAELQTAKEKEEKEERDKRELLYSAEITGPALEVLLGPFTFKTHPLPITQPSILQYTLSSPSHLPSHNTIHS